MPLDSSACPGAPCKVTLWRMKVLVMARVAQIKVKYHIQSSSGVFAIKLGLGKKMIVFGFDLRDLGKLNTQSREQGYFLKDSLTSSL